MHILALSFTAKSTLRVEEVAGALAAIAGALLFVGAVTPLPRQRCERAVGRRVPVLDARQLVEHLPVVLGYEPEVELELELLAPTGEILVELVPQPVEGPRGSQHARPIEPRERLEVMLGLGVEADPAHAAIGHADEQRPHRGAVHDLEPDVEQLGPTRRRAGALVEGGG